ncbi:MAG: Ribonuclease Z [Syntrophorhabdus sp. PtaU1.Bin050]|nr:MAG: Ribonuclease Z [Syntrophorhabdus sp. PtaU1.Bin050]
MKPSSGIRDMRLKVLGTGTSVPSLQRGSSSYLLAAKGRKVLIDVGPSVVRRLLEVGFTTRDVDVIILTHFHVDHTADLSTFLFASNYDVEPRTKSLAIVGGAGIGTFYKGLCAVYPWLMPKSYELSLVEMSEGTEDVGGLMVTTTPVSHNSESIGVRIEDRKSITFSGDTDYSMNLVSIASQTDLLVTECSFPERKAKGHLNLATLQRIVDEAHPKRVLISHLYPEWENFRGVLHAPYLLAEDGLELEV